MGFESAFVLLSRSSMDGKRSAMFVFRDLGVFETSSAGLQIFVRIVYNLEKCFLWSALNVPCSRDES